MQIEAICPFCHSKHWNTGGPLGRHCCRCDADLHFPIEKSPLDSISSEDLNFDMAEEAPDEELCGHEDRSWFKKPCPKCGKEE